MATISDARNRGQLILIGALALAVGLVAMALVLNSAIYTHNLASRADSPGDTTITYARDVRINAGKMVDYANRNFDPYGSPGTSGTVLGEYLLGLGNLSNELAENSARLARLSSIEHVSGSDVEGVRVVDNDTEFQPAAGATDEWNVTAETRVRQFKLVVEGNLDSQTDTETDDQISNGILATVEDAFVIKFDDGSTTRYVAVYNESLNGNPTVMVHDGSNVIDRCRVGSLPAQIDFASATFGREVCSGLSFLDDLSGPYRVQYFYGDSISGEYELIADVPVDDSTSETGAFTDHVDALNYGAHCGGPTYNSSGGSYPRVEPAVYATNVSATYETDDVTYQSEQRVANNEPGPPPQAPRVTTFNVDETGTTAANGNFTVAWTASDPNGNPVDTTIRVVEPDGDINTISAPGPSPASVNVSGESGVYEIVLVVDDGTNDTLIDGNSREVTELHEDDGNTSGCPP